MEDKTVFDQLAEGFVDTLALGFVFLLLASVFVIAGAVLWALGAGLLWLGIFLFHLTTAGAQALWRYFFKRRVAT
jgi:hypothetical protein